MLAGSCATTTLIIEKSYSWVPGQLIQSNNTDASLKMLGQLIQSSNADASLKMLGFSPAFAAIVWMNYAFGLLITIHTQIQSEKVCTYSKSTEGTFTL